MNSRSLFLGLLFGSLAQAIAVSIGPTTPPPASSPAAPAAPAASPAGQGPSTANASEPSELSGWPITRFEKMIHHSPFAVATAAAPAQAAAPGFAANLYLSGLAKIGDRDFVSISTRDQTGKLSLFAGETSSDGLQVVSVQWADAVGKSKVTVKKGSEFAVLEYDQSILSKPVQVTNPGVPQPGQPAMPGRVAIPRPGTPGAGFVSNPSIPSRPLYQPNINPGQPGGSFNAMNPNPGSVQPNIPVRRRATIVPNGK